MNTRYWYVAWDGKFDQVSFPASYGWEAVYHALVNDGYPERIMLSC